MGIPKIVHILFFLCGLSPWMFLQAQDGPCTQAPLLISMLNKFHYCPPELNQVTSEEVFLDFMTMLDPNGTVLTAADISSLSVFKKQLFAVPDGESTCAFLTAVSAVYRNRIQQVDTITRSILQKPFDFSAADSISFSRRYHPGFAASEAERNIRLVRQLKYKVLKILFTPSAEEPPPTLNIVQRMSNEPGARKKLEIREKRIFQRILEHPDGYETYMASLFFNALASRYDPHTRYFSPREKERFTSEISKEASSFGLSLTEGKNGEVVIGHLVPGGPAWKSNQLHRGDVVVRVKWPGAGEAIDLSWSGGTEASQIINNSGFDNMMLTIQRTNGMLANVPIMKEKIRVEENIIAGYLLDGENKIGYISLPGFYSDLDSRNPLGCANDVAKEILKLQREQIGGLILDLRYNAGGSLYEAIGLLGLFIDEGPLFMIKEKNHKPVLLKDMNRGTAYGGPLVVMVNGLSASASELLAAGLRDYNRALIVGSNTFGKAVAQVILPLDTATNGAIKVSGERAGAFINVTNAKLYRINGVSYQNTGVAPDIGLPDFFSNLDFGEASEPYAIRSDAVDKKFIFNPLPAIPTAELAEKSRSRVDASPGFRKIRHIADSIHQSLDHETVVQLNPDAFSLREMRLSEMEDTMEHLLKTSPASFSVVPAHYDEAVYQADPYLKAMNDILLKKIREDICVEAAYQIMNDFITLTKK